MKEIAAMRVKGSFKWDDKIEPFDVEVGEMPDKRTAESAPSDAQILVWVRGVNRDGGGDWRVGRVHRGYGLPDRLSADGCHGNWDIPFWMPMPEKPE